MERVQKGGFLLLGFLLGSVGPLWDSLFNGLLVALTFLAFWGSRSAREGWKAGKVYIGANVAFLLYFALHTTVVVGGGRMEGNPTYSLFEALLLGFVLIPVYVSALREWMTPRLLRAFLAVFCAGNVCLQCYVCYDMIGFWFLTDLKSALKVLIFTRFGDNREVLGSVYLIEMRAMGMAVAALFAYFLAFRAGRWWKRMVFGGMFLLSLAFLVFTVTKSALLGFAMGFALLNVYLFRLSHWRTRVGMVVLVAVFRLFGELFFLLLLADEQFFEVGDGVFRQEFFVALAFRAQPSDGHFDFLVRDVAVQILDDRGRLQGVDEVFLYQNVCEDFQKLRKINGRFPANAQQVRLVALGGGIDELFNEHGFEIRVLHVGQP